MASRKIAESSHASVRGQTVDSARNIVLRFESILEYFFAHILMSRKEVVRIEDQPPPVKFNLGKNRKHYFDFRATFSDGWRTGFNVKPSDLLERDQTFEKMDAINAVHTPSFSDDILVVTEVEVTRAKGLNAVDVNQARRNRNQSECDQVLDRLLVIGEPIKIWRLQDMIGDPGMVWDAILCLLYDKKVHIQTPGLRFSDDRLVRVR
ncbi:hypothetical protein VKY48_16195 [Endobacterium cereale]|nr:hypothetical protein [Endobacterium cereale]